MADIQILHFLIDLLLKQIQRAFEHHSLLLKAQYLAISGDKLIINLLDEQSKGPPVFLLNIGTSLIVFFSLLLGPLLHLLELPPQIAHHIPHPNEFLLDFGVELSHFVFCLSEHFGDDFVVFVVVLVEVGGEGRVEDLFAGVAAALFQVWGQGYGGVAVVLFVGFAGCLASE
jgi:hypothetical protein